MRVLETRPSFGPTILRIAAGVVFLMHGLQKLSGGGIEGTTGFLNGLGIPAAEILAPVLIAAEIGGGIALILGLLTRFAAIALAIDMTVALLTVHLPNGFFVADGGYELVLLLLASCLSLVVTGAGALSADGVIAPRRTTTTVLEPAVMPSYVASAPPAEPLEREVGR